MDMLKQMQKQIAKLQRDHKQLKEQRTSRGQQRDRNDQSRTRSPSNDRHTRLNKDGVCFFHETYKDRAHKCHPGCKYPKN